MADIEKNISEETENYVACARQEVKRYLIPLSGFSHPFYGISDGKIILCNDFSAYFLNEKNILSNYYKHKYKVLEEKAREDVDDKITKLFETLERASNALSVESDGVLHKTAGEYDVSHVYDLSGKNYVSCSTRNYSFSNVFLGGEAKYKLVKLPFNNALDDYNLILGESIRGKCMIVGRRK